MRQVAARVADAVRPLLAGIEPEPGTEEGAGGGRVTKDSARAAAKRVAALRARVVGAAETIVRATVSVVAERTEGHVQREAQRLGWPEPSARAERTDAADGSGPARRRMRGIDLRDADPRLGPLMTQWRRENVEKIKSLVGKELDTIERMLADGEGRRVESLRDDIQERFGVTRSKAELLARDQVLKLNGKIVEFRQSAAGIEEYIWTTSGDERVREMHAELDGKRFKWSDPPVTNAQGDRNNPGEDYQCRCTAYAVLPELEEESSASGGRQPPRAPRTPRPPRRPKPPASPPPPPKPRSPIIERAAEAAQAIRQVGDSDSVGGRIVRDIVRAQIARRLPRAISRGSRQDRLVTADAELARFHANGAHNWDGSVAITTEVRDRAAAALDDLAHRRAPTLHALQGLRTVVHEEFHGHSATTARSYRTRTLGAVLEEVGTELNARDVVRDLRREATGINAPMPGSYDHYIVPVREIVEQATGLSEADALEKIRDAHVRAALERATAFGSPDEAARAWLDALDVPDRAKLQIWSDLKLLEVQLQAQP